MTFSFTSKRTVALAAPLAVFLGCLLITVYYGFRLPGDRLPLALLGDMVITAPLLYLLLARTTTLSKWVSLRIAMAGILLAGLLLRNSGNEALSVLQTWIYPVLEGGLVLFVVQRFARAKRAAQSGDAALDFLQHCRTVLASVLGSTAAGSVLASEVAVFYYAFKRASKRGMIDTPQFTTYKGTGIRLVLGTFLCLFLVETAGMHFLFMLWSHTAAWILTGLSAYTCLQLFAHIRAIALRPVVIAGGHLYLRNGLMGGEAVIPLERIERVEACHKELSGPGVQKLAFIKGLEKHNTAIHLSQPVELIKAFGIRRRASIVLLHIDQQREFMAMLVRRES